MFGDFKIFLTVRTVIPYGKRIFLLKKYCWVTSRRSHNPLCMIKEGAEGGSGLSTLGSELGGSTLKETWPRGPFWVKRCPAMECKPSLPSPPWNIRKRWHCSLIRSVRVELVLESTEECWIFVSLWVKTDILAHLFLSSLWSEPGRPDPLTWNSSNDKSLQAAGITEIGPCLWRQWADI